MPECHPKSICTHTHTRPIKVLLSRAGYGRDGISLGALPALFFSRFKRSMHGMLPQHGRGQVSKLLLLMPLVVRVVTEGRSVRAYTAGMEPFSSTMRVGIGKDAHGNRAELGRSQKVEARSTCPLEAQGSNEQDGDRSERERHATPAEDDRWKLCQITCTPMRVCAPPKRILAICHNAL